MVSNLVRGALSFPFVRFLVEKYRWYKLLRSLRKLSKAFANLAVSANKTAEAFHDLAAAIGPENECRDGSAY